MTTNCFFKPTTKPNWAILVILASLVMTWEARGEDRWPDNVPSRRLTDGEAKQSAPETKDASYRMTDRGHKSAYPRVPGKLLSELADAAIPSTLGSSKSKKKATSSMEPRALPPIDVDPNTIENPVANGTELGGDCRACETCGLLDTNRRESKGPGDECDICGGSELLCQCRYRPGHEGWFRNSVVFISGDGWKNIFDDDDNNNFGFRTGFNMGIDLPGQRAVRGQIGMSYGAYDFHGREGLVSRDDPIEQQMFGTAGVYKPSMVQCDDRLAWGVVYDAMYSLNAGERADTLKLAQLRGYFGFALNDRNEIGTWVTSRFMRDYAVRQGVQVNVTDQANLFWHHTWKLGGDTMAYVGWADDPGMVVLGLHGRVPLNNYVALVGNVHYIVPSTTGGDVHPTIGADDIFSQESWNVSFGIMFYRGGKAVSRNVSGVFGLPLLPVADNGSFSFQANMF